MICVILNILVLAMGYEGAPQVYSGILENINTFFTSIFMFEMIVKLISHGKLIYIILYKDFMDIG